ncbi:MAG: hypothetical protein ACTSPN_09570 [Promethearchaeota archaeon]
MRMPHDTSSSEEVVVRLLQEETPITIKIHGDYLKLVEKKTPKKEPIPEVQVTAEDLITDLEKAISFDEEEEDYYDDSTEREVDEKMPVSYEDDDEFEDDDEWAKFDGF